MIKLVGCRLLLLLLLLCVHAYADGYRGSVKMHKDRGAPLVLGPIWDLNEAFGLCCGYPIEGVLAARPSSHVCSALLCNSTSTGSPC